MPETTIILVSSISGAIWTITQSRVVPPRLCPCDVCDPEPDDLPVPDYEIGGEA